MEADLGWSGEPVTFKMELFVTTVTDFSPMAVITKNSIWDIGGVLYPPLLMIYPYCLQLQIT